VGGYIFFYPLPWQAVQLWAAFYFLHLIPLIFHAKKWSKQLSPSNIEKMDKILIGWKAYDIIFSRRGRNTIILLVGTDTIAGWTDNCDWRCIVVRIYDKNMYQKIKGKEPKTNW